MEFKGTAEHGNAHALSRLPLLCQGNGEIGDAAQLFSISQIEALPFISKHIRDATRRDDRVC